jgi:hypothetical protein
MGATVKLGGRPSGALRPALALRDDLRKNGGALDGVRALPAKGKNFSFRGCIRRPMGDPPGPTVPPYAVRRRFARSLSVHSGR